MTKSISREYKTDGSVVCTSDYDPTRTAIFDGPANSAEQLAAVATFFAAEPDLDETGNVIASGFVASVKSFFGLSPS